MSSIVKIVFFFFNDTATTEIYTLSLHDALPICFAPITRHNPFNPQGFHHGFLFGAELLWARRRSRSEEHTSELQSRQYLVCRLLLEKKKKTISLISLDNSSTFTRYHTLSLNYCS